MQLLGLGAPLLELGARYVVWLYMPALLCVLAGIRFLKDGFLVLVYRHDLVRQARLQLARNLAFQGVLGLMAGPVVLFAIYFRKELFQCVTGLI